MEINLKHEENLIIELSGRLDTNSSQEFDERLAKEEINEKSVILDFKNLEYISSAGLRTLLALKNRLAGSSKELVITNVNPIVHEVFVVTGFINVLNIK